MSDYEQFEWGGFRLPPDRRPMPTMRSNRGGYIPDPQHRRPAAPPASAPPGGGRSLEEIIHQPSWSRGVLDEQRMHNHGLSDEQRRARDLLVFLMRDSPRQPVAVTIARVLYVHLAGEPRRVRIRAMKRAVFGP